MIIKNNKVVELTKSEYEDIQLIWGSSTCLADAYDKMCDYLDKNHKFDNLDYRTKSDIASNIVNAVVNNYKYLKVRG